MDCDTFRSAHVGLTESVSPETRTGLEEHRVRCRACDVWLSRMITERTRRRQESREARDAQLEAERAARRAEMLGDEG